MKDNDYELLHELAEQLAAALYSDEWRTREYGIAAFARYCDQFPKRKRVFEYYEQL